MILQAAALVSLLQSAPSNVPACRKAAQFAGTICVPPAPGKHPAIVLLGGSEGGDSMAATAAQFAKHGYVAASVAYFRMPGLPQTLENIPVETVGKALGAIEQRPDVDGSKIGLFGISKGGELALLAASVYPQFRAVVADVPSPFAWQGIAQGYGEAESSWTYEGKPLAYVPYAAAMGTIIGQAYATGKPLDLRKGYDASMAANAPDIPAAMFHLEKIRGPVLLLSAGDDRIWNSPKQCEIALSYLRAHHHPYADEYLRFPGAGHVFLFATADRPLTQASLGRLPMLLGGTPNANAAAAHAAWPKITAFLTAALK